MTFLSLQLRSTKIIGWLYPGGEICVMGCHVTSRNQGLSSNDQGRQRRETLGTRLINLTPEFKWASFAQNNNNNNNNLDELITCRPRLKKDLWSKFRFGPKIRPSRQAQSGIRSKIHSWSTFHCIFKIRESARFTTKIHNLCAFYCQIRRSQNLFTPLSRYTD